MGENGSIGVSVVVPTYNRGYCIAAAVESALRQTYAGLEVIVVDDGSDDDTRQRLETLGNRVRYLRTDHRGAAAARNAGLREARGSWIAWLDSDDRWLPFKLELQMQVAERLPDVALVASDFSAERGDGRIERSYGMQLFPYYRRYEQELRRIYDESLELRFEARVGDEAVDTVRVFAGRIYHRMIWGNLLGTPTVMFRRRLLEEVGLFDESLQVYEDYDFHLRLSRVARVAYVDLPTMVYQCDHTDRLTYRGDLAQRVRRVEVLLGIRRAAAARDPELTRRFPGWIPATSGRAHAKLAELLAHTDRRSAFAHWWHALGLAPRSALAPALVARLLLPAPLLEALRKLRGRA